MNKKKEAVTDQDNRIVVFQEKSIRRTQHQNEWWFVVEDVVLVLVDSKDPKQYIQRMKQRDPELAKGWVQIVHTLPIETFGGTQRGVKEGREYAILTAEIARTTFGVTPGEHGNIKGNPFDATVRRKRTVEVACQRVGTTCPPP